MKQLKKSERFHVLLINTFLLFAFLVSCSQEKNMTDKENHPKQTGKNSELVVFSFDDHSIPWKDNLELTMVRPEKYAANPVVKRGEKGSVDEWAVQFYGSVIFHEDKYKLWYIAADDESLELIKKGKGFSGLRPAYAESEDGIHWQKPNLGLVEHNGNKQNNLVKIDPPEVGGIHLIVIHEPEEPNPDRQFKMLLTVAAQLEKGKGSSSIVLYSPDGLRWESATPVHFNEGFLSQEDLLLPMNFEQGGLFKWKGVYHLPGQIFSPTAWQPDGKTVGRVMAVLRSPDLLNWDPAMSYSFIRDGMSGKEVPPGLGEEAHLAASVWNRGNVLLGLYGLWHGAEAWEDRSMDLGFLLSNDGINFREPISDYVLIKSGAEGDWDHGGLIQGQGFDNIGEKTFIWYGSWDMTKPSYPPRGGVGLVTLRKDGFGYLSPKYNDQTAHFITKTIEQSELASNHFSLYINADGVSEDAPVRIELVDAKGMPIPGYSGNDAALIKNDGLYTEVQWAGAAHQNVVEINSAFAIKVNYPPNEKVKFYALYLNPEKP